MSTDPGASTHLYLFIYANDLLTCAFALNINISLFTYYNRCQQKQVQAPTCICLFMQNCLLTCAFTLNINISLFTYDNRCQQKQVDASGWRRKERGIGLIFSQKQEVKSVASRYSVSSDSNLIAVKDLIYLCILRIICNCRFFSQ